LENKRNAVDDVMEQKGKKNTGTEDEIEWH